MDLESFILSMQQRLDDALQGLPAEAQVDTNTIPGVAVRACRRLGTAFSEMLTKLREKGKELNEMAEKKKGEITGQVRAALIKNPEADADVVKAFAENPAFLKAAKLITEADHNTAILAANGKVKEGVDAALLVIKQSAERRKKLVTDKVLTSVAAEALPDELLAGDNFMVGITNIKGRLEKLAAIKSLAADGDTIKRVVTMPVTAEGDAAFNDSFSIWEKAGKGSKAAPGAPLNPPAPEGDGEKPVLFF